MDRWIPKQKKNPVKAIGRELVSEHDEQVALFDWAKRMPHPQLDLMFAIPNGGHRHIAVAAKLKREGVKAGVPDIFLPVAVDGRFEYEAKYHGLFIEMKYGKNKTTKGQDQWIEALKAEGYAVKVCYGFEQARDAIVEYLGIEVR